MTNKKAEPLDEIKSVMMLADDALSPVQIGNLIQKNLRMQVSTPVIKSTLENNPALFYKLGRKWKINVGID